MNKSKLYMIVCICILVLSIGGSYAYFEWILFNNELVSLNVCTPNITFTGGATIKSGDLVPVLKKEDGVIKDIEVKANKDCNSDIFMNLYMKLDKLGSGLSDKTFVYEVYKDNILLSSGNFVSYKEGDTIELTTNDRITTTASIYTVYIYLDGKQDNPSSTQKQNFSFTLWGEGTNAIYKENVIIDPTPPSSGDSTFLNTDILRKEIESITIEKDNNVPDGVTGSIDISSNKDGSVMLWYTKNDNGLYAVSIGGENGVVQTNTNGSGMFAYLTNIEALDLTYLDTSNMTNMSKMFYGSSGLKNINLSNFDTSNVTTMFEMFRGCSNLESLDVSSFNTSNVLNMSCMFYNCYNIETLDLSNFNTSKVINMNLMFYSCSNLKELNVDNFDTSNVINMGHMFSGLTSLNSLNLESFNTSKVNDMSQMFRGCSKLSSLDLSKFDTSNVTGMSYMFGSCSSLTNIDLRNADFSNVTYYTSMFGVPTTSTIYVKDETQKTWITSKFNNLTNVIIP